MAKLLGLLFVCGLAIFGVMYIKDSADTKSTIPNVDVPSGKDAGEGAGKALDSAGQGAGWLSDFVMSLSSTQFGVLVSLILAGLAIVSWRKFPAFKWMLTGMFLLAIAYTIFT